jgi:hypothetical protein
MKYVTTRRTDGKEEIFIFPRDVHHDCMAEALNRIRSQSWGDWHRVFREPIAAGFVEGGKCVGASETLGLKSRDEDTALLSLANTKS